MGRKLINSMFKRGECSLCHDYFLGFVTAGAIIRSVVMFMISWPCSHVIIIDCVIYFLITFIFFPPFYINVSSLLQITLTMGKLILINFLDKFGS